MARIAALSVEGLMYQIVPYLHNISKIKKGIIFFRFPCLIEKVLDGGY